MYRLIIATDSGIEGLVTLYEDGQSIIRWQNEPDLSYNWCAGVHELADRVNSVGGKLIDVDTDFGDGAWVTVESSNIERVGLVSEAVESVVDMDGREEKVGEAYHHTLRVRFKDGALYEYIGDKITPELFVELLRAESQGRYLRQHVQGPDVPYRKVENQAVRTSRIPEDVDGSAA